MKYLVHQRARYVSGLNHPEH